MRLRPILALFELNETGTRALQHSVSLYRLYQHGPVRRLDDPRIPSNNGAVHHSVQTVLFADANGKDYKMFKQDIYVKRREEKKDQMCMARNTNAEGDLTLSLWELIT